MSSRHVHCWTNMKMLDDISIEMERSSRKSLHQLSVQSGMCKPTAHRTTKLLELRPYKISHTTHCSTIESRKPVLQVVLRNVSLCISWPGNSGFLFFGWGTVYLKWKCKSQECSIYPHAVMKLPCMTIKLEWCAVSTLRIVGSMVFKETITRRLWILRSSGLNLFIFLFVGCIFFLID